VAQQEQCAPSDAWARVKSRLRAELGEDVFASWFRGVEVEQVDDEVVRLTVATRFLRNWLRSHYYDFVLRLSRGEWPTVERVEFRVRQPHFGVETPKEAPRQRRTPAPPETEAAPLPMPLRTGYGGFEGSPLDPRLSFASFVVGASNRLACAAAQEVAAAFSAPQPLFNPLFVHGNVGLGKTHLLHAISWDVKQQKPEAQVLYLTAERFMSGFVQALRARDALAFKEKLRRIDILLIDDMEFLQGPTIQQEFCHTLNSLIDGGRQVVVAADRAAEALELVESERPDLVLLDAVLPDGSGFEVCGRLRAGEPGRAWNRDVAVIMVTTRGDSSDRVRGFARGADDYVVRPFVYEELLARMRAVLRRTGPRQHPRLAVQDLVIDLLSRVVRVGDVMVQLSAKEFDLLVALAEDPERVFHKEELLRDVWGFRSSGRTRTLDSHASRLRRKLNVNGESAYVVNVWGVGYRLVAAA